jgi:hypothetical protein
VRIGLIQVLLSDVVARGGKSRVAACVCKAVSWAASLITSSTTSCAARLARATRLRRYACHRRGYRRHTVRQHSAKGAPSLTKAGKGDLLAASVSGMTVVPEPEANATNGVASSSLFALAVSPMARPRIFSMSMQSSTSQMRAWAMMRAQVTKLRRG